MNLTKENFIKDFETAIEKEKSLYLAFLDLNSMKMINDTYGHFAGDAVIRITQEVLNLVPQFATAKFGGDEFLIQATGVDHLFLTSNIKYIQNKLKSHPDLQKYGGISASVGVAKYEQQVHHGFDGCFKHADKLMYRAKKNPPQFTAYSWEAPREKRELNTQGSRLRSFFEWVTTTLVKEHPTTPFKSILHATRESFEDHENILEYSPKLLFAIVWKKLENTEKMGESK